MQKTRVHAARVWNEKPSRRVASRHVTSL